MTEPTISRGEGQGRVGLAFADKVGSKPWQYLLIPHEQVTEDKRVVDFLQFEPR